MEETLNNPDQGASSYKDGPDLNSRIMLLQLQNNDPAVTSAQVYWKKGTFVNTVDWEKQADALANNTPLKSFKLQVLGNVSGNTVSYRPNGYNVNRANFEAFCKGLANNRTIEWLNIQIMSLPANLMDMLSPMIEHNPNLCQLEMNTCEMNYAACRVLTSALSRRENKSSLKKVDLTNTMFSGKESQEVIVSLSQYRNLAYLSLGGNQLGLKGYVELGMLLQNHNCQLEELYIECNQIDDECLEVLTLALLGSKLL